MIGLFGVLPAIASAPETQVLYLSGTGCDNTKPWDFYCTGGRRAGEWTTIPVPSCWEQQGFGVYEYGLEHRPSKHHKVAPPADEKGLYRLKFTVPASWGAGHVRLVFEGVMTDAEVKVNGRLAGPVHRGAFYRFRYDVTPLLRFGEANLLEVTVAKLSADPGVNAAERYADFWNFGGIFRPVYLERVPADYIDRVAVDARADGTFTGDIFLGPGIPAGDRVDAVFFEGADGTTACGSASIAVPEGAASVTLRARVASPRLWTAETPHLYHVRLTLARGASPLHAVTQVFGFRTFEVRAGDGLYLNGSKIRLKGVNRHSFWPETGRTLDRSICFEDARLMKEANINAVRMSHYPPDADFLDACDRLGLYVLDELAGWHGKYDTPTGRKLVGEMVRRDVNHPSVLFWDNGNEGGFNRDLDGQFALWDPQHRPVLHPWATFSHVDTSHYPDYERAVKLAQGPDIFMPTEFEHAIYDGGGAAGLADYWTVMGHEPRAAGGFIWAFLDESVARTDQGGRLDSKDSWAPDGIVGPHREKEGSYYAIRQIWSPIQVGPERLPEDFGGELAVENDYDFLNLDSRSFSWELVRFPAPSGDAPNGEFEVLDRGELRGPPVPPHGRGRLQIPLPASWRKADALYLSARDPDGKLVRKWSWNWKRPSDYFGPQPIGTGTPVGLESRPDSLVVRAGSVVARFDPKTGELACLSRDGRTFSLGRGPRLVAFRRPIVPQPPPASLGFNPGRTFADVSGPETLTDFSSAEVGTAATVSVGYSGHLQSVRWWFFPNGDIVFDYRIAFDGTADILGIAFDYPETKVLSKTWLGGGPYHVWQNRLQGATFGVWRNAYNDTVPGDSWIYPEFKGFFSDWKWAVFATEEGNIAILNQGGAPYLGVYKPNDGRVSPVLPLPPLGLGVYYAIPAMANKNATPELLGPHSQPAKFSGILRGSLRLRFLTP